jgi:hypothetical protein
MRRWGGCEELGGLRSCLKGATRQVTTDSYAERELKPVVGMACAEVRLWTGRFSNSVLSAARQSRNFVTLTPSKSSERLERTAYVSA